MKMTSLGLVGIWLPAVLVGAGAGLVAQQQPHPQTGSPPQAAAANRPPENHSQTPAPPNATAPNTTAPNATVPDAPATRSSANRPILGVMLERSRTSGVLVTAVLPDGPADVAGIQEGDYILAIDDQRVNAPEALSDLIASAKIGDGIRVTVWRDGGQQELKATLSNPPGFGPSGHGEGRHDRPQSSAQDSHSPWIGAWLTKPREGSGAAISGIYPSGPAARAGLYSGDVIVKIEQQAVSTPAEAAEAIRKLSLDQPVEMTVRREGEELTVSLQPLDRQRFGGIDIAPPSGDDDFADFDERLDVPEHAMMLEQHRRLAEQHERIEHMIQTLTDEVRQLRAEVKSARAQN